MQNLVHPYCTAAGDSTAAELAYHIIKAHEAPATKEPNREPVV